MADGKSIAVLLPCYNEQASIAAVIESFRRALPGAAIYVYDNNSTDRTAAIAMAAGAVVRREPFQGKGYVVRRMFADIEADIYVLADGDLTYDASAAGRLVEALVRENVDMVVGSRVGPDGAFPRGHRFGNRFFNLVVARLFGNGLTDILSGYRVVSRRFAKSFPAASTGFEIETELSVHALDLKLATTEVPLPYGKRVENSVSKLRTFRDGFRILFMILRMYRTLRPFQFFGVISLALAVAALVLIAPVLLTYLETGLVPRLPTAILAAVMMQLAFLSLTCGFVIDAISTTRREIKRMRYLDLPAPAAR
ncbi:MAG TPA: glycosyltransferase family 2 protein [Vineibacter sp.]|nr:glycosyltransferase family 2 protein [Vineibacter sp.]